MTDHAKQNAAFYAKDIAQMLEAYDNNYETLAELEYQARHDDLTDAEAEELQMLTKACNSFESQEDAERAILEMPLSVEVRSGWHAPGAEAEPEEFQILLSTGGPALRIRGELDNGSPSRAWLEYQDWGTPWTQFFDVEQSTLLRFASFFYFR